MGALYRWPFIGPDGPIDVAVEGPLVVNDTDVILEAALIDRRCQKAGSHGVFSKNAWRLADMGARHAFLRAGFGFGNMPCFMVEDDIASGKLRAIRIELATNLKPIGYTSLQLIEFAQGVEADWGAHRRNRS